MRRLLVLTLVGFFLLTVAGPLQSLFGLEMVAPDIPLILLLYLVMAARGIGGLRAPARPKLLSSSLDFAGGIAGVGLGYVHDLLGGGLLGLHSLTMGLMFLLLLWAGRHVLWAGNISVIAVTAASSFVASLIAVALRWIVGVLPSLATLAVIVAQSALCGVLAPVLMRLFRWIDFRLARGTVERGSLTR